jgi:hypothetical protein
MFGANGVGLPPQVLHMLQQRMAQGGAARPLFPSHGNPSRGQMLGAALGSMGSPGMQTGMMARQAGAPAPMPQATTPPAPVQPSPMQASAPPSSMPPQPQGQPMQPKPQPFNYAPNLGVFRG